MIFGNVKKVKSELTEQQIADFAADGYVTQRSADYSRAKDTAQIMSVARNTSLGFSAAGVVGVVATAAVAPAILPVVGVGLLAASAASLSMAGVSAFFGKRAKEQQYQAESDLYSVKNGNLSKLREHVQDVLFKREPVDFKSAGGFKVNADKLQEMAKKHIALAMPR